MSDTDSQTVLPTEDRAADDTGASAETQQFESVSLDSILKGDTPAQLEAAETTEATPASPEPEGLPKDDEPKENFVPVTALLDERDKRKEAQENERRVREELDRLRKPSETQDLAKIPDWENDEKGYIDARLEQIKTDLTVDFTQKWYTGLEAAAMAQFGQEEYTRAREAFIAEAQKEPGLAQTMHMAQNPALFVYQKGNELLMRQGLDGKDPFERIRELEARLAEKGEERKPVPAATTALSSAPGAAEQPAFELEPIGNILKTRHIGESRRE